jgi:hypothetical protein
VTVLLTSAAYLLPASFPIQILSIASTFGSYLIAKHLQNGIVSEHFSAGGSLGSWWTAVGAGLLACAAFVMTISLIALAF